MSLLDESLDLDQNHFSPKKLYFSLSHHLYEILKRNKHYNRTVYSFSIYQNKEIDNYEIITKDIQGFSLTVPFGGPWDSNSMIMGVLASKLGVPWLYKFE